MKTHVKKVNIWNKVFILFKPTFFSFAAIIVRRIVYQKLICWWGKTYFKVVNSVRYDYNNLFIWTLRNDILRYLKFVKGLMIARLCNTCFLLRSSILQLNCSNSIWSKQINLRFISIQVCAIFKISLRRYQNTHYN